MSSDKLEIHSDFDLATSFPCHHKKGPLLTMAIVVITHQKKSDYICRNSLLRPHVVGMESINKLEQHVWTLRRPHNNARECKLMQVFEAIIMSHNSVSNDNAYQSIEYHARTQNICRSSHPTIRTLRIEITKIQKSCMLYSLVVIEALVGDNHFSQKMILSGQDASPRLRIMYEKASVLLCGQPIDLKPAICAYICKG